MFKDFRFRMRSISHWNEISCWYLKGRLLSARGMKREADSQREYFHALRENRSGSEMPCSIESYRPRSAWASKIPWFVDLPLRIRDLLSVLKRASFLHHVSSSGVFECIARFISRPFIILLRPSNSMKLVGSTSDSQADLKFPSAFWVF